MFDLFLLSQILAVNKKASNRAAIQTPLLTSSENKLLVEGLNL